MLYLRLYQAKQKMIKKVSDFIHKERGGSEIIAIVAAVVIVLGLVGVFWNKIQDIWNQLWSHGEVSEFGTGGFDGGGG